MAIPYTKSMQAKIDLYTRETPRELVQSMESFLAKLQDVSNPLRNPDELYSPEMTPIVTSYMMESFQNNNYMVPLSESYNEYETVCLESMTDDEHEVAEAVSMPELHRHNITQLLENSASEMRVANANMRNIGELTPFDAFLPFIIVRSYAALVAKDLIPYVVPTQHFIRIKEQYKYIVTKDNKRYLRPDVYNNYEDTLEILASAKGKRVTDAWYPEATEVDATTGNPDWVDNSDAANPKGYKFSTDPFKVEQFDLLAESGGSREIGDALDINICIEGARALVTNSNGNTQMVEVTGLQGYMDTTSISPKQQMSARVKFPIKNDDGTIEGYIEDTIMGIYDVSNNRIDLSSLHGTVKQVQFGGNLSNKNNTEYISFQNEFESYQHPIPEGFRSNMPITLEDMRLYQETADIGIVAHGINEMTEMFANLEDSSAVATIDKKAVAFENQVHHPFIHFQKGPVSVYREVDVAYEQNNPFMKRTEFIQDKISSEIRNMIADIRNTCQNEPFRIVLYAHPNVASLFVGNNVDWKITAGNTAVADGIRSDYNMGIYTQSGDSMRLISSVKFRESDGVAGLVYPVNEQNFLTWKHFKRAIYFDRDHKINNMPNNPNLMGVATFHTHDYIPFRFRLAIKNYR